MTRYNHEHDEHGRFAASDSGGAAADKPQPPPPPIGPKAQFQINNFEDSVRAAPVEHFLGVNDDGQTYTKEGEVDHVHFSDAEVAELQQMKLTVYSHNHPSGRSFSNADVSFGRKIGVAEIRAVAEEGTYVMRGLPKDALKFRRLLEDFQRLDNDQWHDWSKRVSLREMTSEYATLHHPDAVWRRVTELPEWRDTMQYHFEAKKK